LWRVTQGVGKDAGIAGIFSFFLGRGTYYLSTTTTWTYENIYNRKTVEATRWTYENTGNRKTPLV
jgi:hypothetical protein